MSTTDDLAEVRAALAGIRTAPLWQLPESEVVQLRRDLQATAAMLAAVTLTVTREIDARGAAVSLGAPSTVAWLTGSLHLHPGAARREVTLAHALQASPDGTAPDPAGPRVGGELVRPLPATGAALAAGQLSLASAGEIERAVRALPDTVPAEDREKGETFLLAQAAHLRPDQLRRLGAHLLHALDPDHAAGLEAAEADAVEHRELFVQRGAGTLRGRLDAEAIEALLAAIDPLAAPHPATDGVRDPRSPARRRADALVDLVALALSCGQLPETGGEPPQVLITVPLATLHTPPTPHPGAAVPARAGELPDGTPLSPEAARRLGCDATLIAALLGPHGEVLDIGRATRTIPRALIARDRGCAFPGCDRPPAWCQGHHIRHWAHGGDTDLDNLVLLCDHHHRVIHHHGWTVHIGEHRLPIFTPPRWIDPAQIPITRPWRTALHPLPQRE